MTEPRYLKSEEWGKIFAKAWRSEDFKLAFESNPIQALKDHFHGEILVDDNFRVFRIKDKPEDIPLDEIDLRNMASGTKKVIALPYTCTC